MCNAFYLYLKKKKKKKNSDRICYYFCFCFLNFFGARFLFFFRSIFFFDRHVRDDEARKFSMVGSLLFQLGSRAQLKFKKIKETGKETTTTHKLLEIYV